MGGRKLWLSTRRNKERRKSLVNGLTLSIPVRHTVHFPPLTVSLPRSCYNDAPTTNASTLGTRIASLPQLPPTWVVSSTSVPITLCKLRNYNRTNHPLRVDVPLTLTVDADLKWSLSFLSPKLDPSNCRLLSDLPGHIHSVSSLLSVISLLDSSNMCA